MAISSNKQLKSIDLPSGRHSAVLGPRRVHGGLEQTGAFTGEVLLYQPQDGVNDSFNRVADIASRMLRMGGEPEDARITGGTRSLMRRLSGLNIGEKVVRRTQPKAARSIVKSLQLANANVA